MTISVIVPVYNVEKYLAKCLDSLVNQTHKEFEIILVNDGSTDSSQSIIESYQAQYPQRIILINQENAGQSAARNRGIQEAKGKYIYFLDSDDYIKPDTLAIMYKTAEMNKLDYVIDGFEQVDEDGIKLSTYSIPTIPHNVVFDPRTNDELFLIHNSVWNRLYVRDLIIDNDLHFMSGVWYEDLLFGHQYLIYAKRAMVINQQFYYYVQRPGSIMSSMTSEKNLDIKIVFDELIKYYKEKRVYGQYKELIEFMAINEFYIATMVRLIRTNTMDLAHQVRDAFETSFPNYQKNPRIANFPMKRKLVYKLLNMKMYRILAKLFK